MSEISGNAIQQLSDALNAKIEIQTPSGARDVSGIVTQADGGGIWVIFDDGEAPTPCAATTVAIAPNDRVMVRVFGGKAIVTGNMTAPSVGESDLDGIKHDQYALTSRISGVEGGFSEIKQTSDIIKAEVHNAMDEFSRIEQTAEGWTWVETIKDDAQSAKDAADGAATAAGEAIEAAEAAQDAADDAATKATGYLSYKNGRLRIGKMDSSGEPDGNFVAIDNDSVDIVANNNLCASFGTVTTDAPEVMSNNVEGLILDSGYLTIAGYHAFTSGYSADDLGHNEEYLEFRSAIVPKHTVYSFDGYVRSGMSNVVLASGAVYLHESQQLNLSEPVSRQNNGIVICLSAYSGGAQDYQWHTYFIPKYLVPSSGSRGFNIPLVSSTDTGTLTQATKYVYVSNTYIKGHTLNDAGNNAKWCVRYVLGV